MKISQIFDPKLDQSDIESEYLWRLNYERYSKKIVRVNLRTLKLNYSFIKSPLSQMHITNYLSLPNNHFFASYKKDRCIWYLFISDENGKIKIIETLAERSLYFASCFYDDSIFIFRSNWCAKRYSVSQNKWINLPKSPFFCPKSCIGFNQKILIFNDNSEWQIYDILLDSYSDHSQKEPIGNFFFKNAGKIYSVWETNKSISYCSNLFSEWVYCGSVDLLASYFVYFTPFNGSIYFAGDKALYEFSLENFKSKLLMGI